MKTTTRTGANGNLMGVWAITFVALIGCALVFLGPTPSANATGTAQPVAPDRNPSPPQGGPSPARGEGGGAGGTAESRRAGTAAPLEREPIGEVLGDVVGGVAGVGLAPGTVVEIVDDGWITTTESGSGTGVGATAIGDKLSESFDGSAPNVGLSGGGSASGGGAKRTGKSSAFVPPEGLASNPLIWAGIACGLLGVGAGVWMKNIRAALALGGLGAAFLVAALFPGFLLLIVAGAAVIGGVVYLRSESQKTRMTEAARALTAAMDHPKVGDEAKAELRHTLTLEADAADLRTIAGIKAKDAGLAFAGMG